MRCPNCTERNSVAARKCEFCGERFKRKPMSTGMKLAVGGIALAVTASIAAAFMVPRYVDPEQRLARVAKRMAAGPTSIEDAKREKKELASAIRTYLKDNGQAKSSDLSTGLQKRLPSSAYEVHIADLPRGIRVVEIDTMLQASDYLLMKTPAGAKVFDLPGLEVFDDARLINDTAGPILALIGHSGGMPPHRPIVRTYALMPDFINDETDKIVPPLKQNGRAKFTTKGEDIALEVTGAGNHPSKTYGLLHWANARYTNDFSTAMAHVSEKQFEEAVASASPALAAPPASAPVSRETGKQANAIASAAVDTHGKPTKHKPAKIVIRGLNDVPVNNALTDGQGALSGASLGAVSHAATPIASQALVSAMPATQPAEHGRHHAGSGKDRSSNHNVKAPTAPSVSQKTTAAASSSVTSHAASSATSTRKAAIVAVAGASLRTRPTKGAPVISNLVHGTPMQVLDQHGHWYHVRCNGQDGYVYAPLLAVGGTNNETKPTDVTAGSHSEHKKPADLTAVAHSEHKKPANLTAVAHSEHKKHAKATRLVADVSQHEQPVSIESHSSTKTSLTNETHNSAKKQKHAKHEQVQEAPNLVP